MTSQLQHPKTVFLFPGVSAQYAGMFDEFREYSDFNHSLEEVSDATSLDLKDIVFGAQSSRLGEVKIAQITLLAVTVGVAQVLKRECAILPDLAMGHSLGQFSALCSTGYLDLTRASKILMARADALGACSQQQPDGEMCWVLHVPSSVVVEQVNQARQRGLETYVSAIDSFDQATISGSMEQIRAFAPSVEAMGGLFFPLRIGGAFHSPLMASAAQAFEAELEGLLPPAASPFADVICNVSAEPVQCLRTSLVQHLVQPVRWLESMQYLTQQGMTRFVEISPKTVLSYLVDRSNLPMQAVCDTEKLADFVNQNRVQETVLKRAESLCMRLLFRTKLPSISDRKVTESLIAIRRQAQAIAVSEPVNTAELLRLTQQWLQWLMSCDKRAKQQGLFVEQLMLSRVFNENR